MRWPLTLPVRMRERRRLSKKGKRSAHGAGSYVPHYGAASAGQPVQPPVSLPRSVRHAHGRSPASATMVTPWMKLRPAHVGPLDAPAGAADRVDEAHLVDAGARSPRLLALGGRLEEGRDRVKAWGCLEEGRTRDGSGLRLVLLVLIVLLPLVLLVLIALPPLLLLILPVFLLIVMIGSGWRFLSEGRRCLEEGRVRVRRGLDGCKCGVL
mmetsp:Transcript_6198/g.16546  ORF Transcript_6198/g.16546 Transcript_6198/m.16546 type:complete len:210 (-) Transcript_6198:160-789(-)